MCGVARSLARGRLVSRTRLGSPGLQQERATALRSARSDGDAFMRPQSHIVSISLLSGKDWSKVISLTGTSALGVIFKLDREQANLLRAHILHRMRRQRL